jgi:hypothetical protein
MSNLEKSENFEPQKNWGEKTEETTTYAEYSAFLAEGSGRLADLVIFLNKISSETEPNLAMLEKTSGEIMILLEQMAEKTSEMKKRIGEDQFVVN